jgi:transcriptional regulator with XRE-family HTH domain
MAQLIDQNWYMTARDVLANNLTALMEAYPAIGSQKLLFRTTGVTTSTIGRIRRAEVSATLDNIEAIARAFKLTPSQLLDPTLPTAIAKLPPEDIRARAQVIAETIQRAGFGVKEIQILENTLAALKSG